MANEKRLIDANALKERAIRVSTVKEHCYMKAVGTHEIDKAPTVDAVEVVRCDKCLHWDDHNNGYGCCKHPHWWCEGEYDAITEHNDFCSYGERREGECI